MPNRPLNYACLIISPDDVQAERRAVAEELARWNASGGRALDLRVEPVQSETHARPEMGLPPQDVLNRQIVDNWDFGIAVFGSKLGSPTVSDQSVSVE